MGVERSQSLGHHETIGKILHVYDLLDLVVRAKSFSLENMSCCLEIEF